MKLNLYLIKIPKILLKSSKIYLVFPDNYIWSGSYNLLLLERKYMWFRVNMLICSPELSNLTKNTFSWLNLAQNNEKMLFCRLEQFLGLITRSLWKNFQNRIFYAFKPPHLLESIISELLSELFLGLIDTFTSEGFSDKRLFQHLSSHVFLS